MQSPWEGKKMRPADFILRDMEGILANWEVFCHPIAGRGIHGIPGTPKSRAADSRGSRCGPLGISVAGGRLTVRRPIVSPSTKRPTIALLAAAMFAFVTAPACGDEGGVRFWAPGQFGSFSAVPTEPGWAVPLIYYHVSANAGASKNFIVGGNRTAGIDATGDLLFFFPTYTFTQPVLGGQAAFGVGWAVGRLRGTAEITVTGP